MIRISSSQEIDILKSLVGQTFKYVGGPGMALAMQCDRVLLVTQETAVSFNCDLVESSFEAEPDEYNIVSVHPARTIDLENTEKNGYFYKQFSGEKIIKVEVVEETVTNFQAGAKNWSFVTDVSFVFTLQTGTVAVTKMSHHMEVLKVTLAKDPEQVLIPETHSRFEEDVFSRNEVSRNRFSIAEAAART